MGKYIVTDILKKLEGAFDTKNNGAYSARKLTSFVVILCTVAAHVSWFRYAYVNQNYSLLSEILFIDYGFVAALLGMTTYSGITEKRLENKKKENENIQN